ncbi:alpha-L-rhamnosidase [hydrothermal vent metagenome]|uniref:alpha-L-rhamnosidase n=2 Tax=hydrothermal vent metagenome TaxID=652676 RepID=A0A3B1BWT2_9ZZZZ
MREIIKIFILFSVFTLSIGASQMSIKNLRCEDKVNPLGVDIVNPRFSWNLESNQRGVKQNAYQILVASSLEDLNAEKADVWNSGKIASDKSIQIYYEGKPLKSNNKYFWKVKVWDQDGKTHTSKTAFWTTGLFKESDWKAKWIGLDKAVGDDDPDIPKRKLSARMLRHEFNINKKIKSATAFISGLGLFELYINGEKIGDQVLSPGLTEYNKRTFYMTFDVTKNLQSSQNAIGVILGNGRYFAPRSDEPTATRTYGFPKVICQLEIKYEDGTTNQVVTDGSWKLTTNGPIRKNNEYDGEYYDARMELKGWDKINYDDSGWMNAELVEKPGELLVAQPNDPIKIMEEVTPIAVSEIKPGMFIFDMGQNMVGWVELFVKGKRGDKVTLRFAERLNDDGSLFLDNIRSAEVTDTYILKGGDNESWEPRFTYHGFRFVEMIGYPGTPTLSSIKGKVVYDSLEVTGSFECSNPLINSIYKNAYWGIRGNYRSIPTDCPQRDERQGWLGDRSAECTGESFIFDISKLYSKWVTDMRDAQKESGSLPDVAPSYWPFYNDNTTWPGTYLFASDMLYNQYGDLKTIKNNYPNMQKWIKYMSQFMKNGIMPKDTYGDWCVPPEDLKLIHTNDPLRTTSSEYIGTAYFYYELKMMEKFAKLLGKENDEAQYSEVAAEMKTAFNKKFLDKKNIRYSNNSQTANILALAFDLVPTEYKERIVDNLLQKILGESDGHVGNGIIGGQWLMRTLTDNGHADVAYLLASQSTYPSWGYMVKQGATTIWELWNGDHGDPAMNSGNHVMLLGDLIIWFYEDLAGIKADPAKPAFKHILMKPYVLGDLKYVTASYNSAYGKITSNWKLDDNKFSWDISIPANTTATISVPTLEKEDVLEGNQLASKSDHISFVRWDDNYAVFEVGSGDYSFSSDGAAKNITKPYASAPVITPSDTIIVAGDKIIATITCDDKQAVIRYTYDGSEPTELSPKYDKPLTITESTSIIAKAFRDGYNPSIQTRVNYDFVDPNKNGVLWELYEGKFKKLPDFDKLKSVKNGKVYQFNLDKIDVPQHNFALKLNSYVQIDKDGEYDFYISSNDGSKLYIDDKLIVDNDGEHGPKQLSGRVYLNKGKHAIRAEYFQSGGSKVLLVFYSSNEISYKPVPGSKLFLNK